MKESYEITVEHLLVDAVSKHAECDVKNIIARADPIYISSIVIKRRGPEQQNLLHITAKKGQFAIFKLLLGTIEDKSHIIKIRDFKNYHALHLALLANHVELARYIIEMIAEPRERIALLEGKRNVMSCKQCVTSPEALELLYQMYDDKTLKYKALQVIAIYYHPGKHLDYSRVALDIFKRELLGVPQGERDSYLFNSTVGSFTVSLLQKAIEVAEHDCFKLFDLIIKELGASDRRDMFCIQGLKYVHSLETLQHLLNCISDKTALLDTLITAYKAKSPLFQFFSIELFSHYLSAIASVDQEAAELIGAEPLNPDNVVNIIDKLQTLHDTRAQALRPPNSTSGLHETRSQRKTRGALLLDYLDDHSLLSLRLVNKASGKFVSQIQGPYSSPQEFVGANSGIYTTANELKEALSAYFTTMRSTSFYPAILYKLREHSFGISTHEFPEKHGESLDATGRKYTPKNHTWNINAAWVLAQLHKGRDFVFLSELVDPYVRRQNGKYSALTKEVAAVVCKAGYRRSVEALTSSSSSFFLRKPMQDNNHLYRLKVEDFLDLKDAECEHTVNLVQSHFQEDSAKIKEWVDRIIKSFTRLYNSQCIETFELTDYLGVRVDFEHLTNFLSLYSHKGKSLPQLFLNYYNEQRNLLQLQQVIPVIRLDFNQGWSHAVAPKLISEKLATAFCDLYCEKENTIGPRNF